MGSKMTASAYLSAMLADGRISQADHDTLKSLVKAESGIIIPGNITLVSETHRDRLEAAARTLNTPELLENILRFGSIKDLLFRIPLTCKGFRHAIDNSPTIYRKMFRQADQRPRRDMEPIPYRFRGPWRLDKSMYTDKFVYELQRRGERYDPRNELEDDEPLTFPNWPSLASVLLVQPTVTKVDVHMSIGECTSDYSRNTVVTDSNGVTFGHVLDVMRQWVEELSAGCYEITVSDDLYCEITGSRQKEESCDE